MVLATTGDVLIHQQCYFKSDPGAAEIVLRNTW
jgi:hypothetical protein